MYRYAQRRSAMVADGAEKAETAAQIEGEEDENVAAVATSTAAAALAVFFRAKHRLGRSSRSLMVFVVMVVLGYNE